MPRFSQALEEWDLQELQGKFKSTPKMKKLNSGRSVSFRIAFSRVAGSDRASHD